MVPGQAGKEFEEVSLLPAGRSTGAEVPKPPQPSRHSVGEPATTLRLLALGLCRPPGQTPNKVVLITGKIGRGRTEQSKPDSFPPLGRSWLFVGFNVGGQTGLPTSGGLIVPLLPAWHAEW